MRFWWGPLCCAFLAACSGAQSGGSSDDLAKWQGTWKLVSATYNGESQMADMRWVVDGDHYNIVLNGQLQQDPYPFKLDPSHRRIDVNHHETPKGTYGGKATGIYRVSENSLTVCYDLTGREYPRSFDAGPGSRRVLYQFQKEQR